MRVVNGGGKERSCRLANSDNGYPKKGLEDVITKKELSKRVSELSDEMKKKDLSLIPDGLLDAVSGGFTDTYTDTVGGFTDTYTDSGGPFPDGYSDTVNPVPDPEINP